MRSIRHIAFILALACSWCLSSFAQTKLLPDVTSTEGREFFVAWLPNVASKIDDRDLKLQLIASSREENHIRVEYAGGTYRDYTIPGNTHTLVIDDLDKKLIYWDIDKGEDEKVLNKGIRVYSLDDKPFTLYSTNQNGDIGALSFDAAHILPVEALGHEYVVQTSNDDAIATEFVVMSTRPGITNVTVNLPVESRKNGSNTIRFTGSKQIYIIRSKSHDPMIPNDNISLSGATVCADQPIAVWSGNQHAIIPLKDEDSHDHAYDQLLPVNKWGKDFLVPLTALHTQRNEVHVIGLQPSTQVSVTNNKGTTSFPIGLGDDSLIVVTARLGGDMTNNTMMIHADKPVQVYLYTSAAGSNPYDDDDDVRHKQGDPSMTMIPPLEYMTDTTIFRTFNGGQENLTHQVVIWSTAGKKDQVRLDNATVDFKQFLTTDYWFARVDVADGVHTVTAPNKAFSGYAYGMNDGQAYLYPIGYDFTPRKDSLFLFDNDHQYKVHWSEWKDKAISATEGGWHLDKILMDNDKYLLDSIFVCDSTTLKFPIKTYEAWYKAIWEIQGSIQGKGYFTPIEQLGANVSRPELEHKFLLLPITQNNKPYEDFEVRGILIRKPLICSDIIPEDKWERDTFNTVVRVLRQYNDTTWRAICVGDTVEFFRDTIWKVSPHPAKPVAGRDFYMQISVFNDTLDNPSQGYHQYSLGATTVTKHYISSGGCDSLSTLKLFVCSPHFEKKDTVVCQNGTSRLDYGDFFLKYKTGNKWPIADTVLYDTLRAKGCMNSAEWREFRNHCRSFNGCDSVLELHLNVKKQTNNSYIVNQCMSQGKIYNWEEKGSGRFIKSFNADTLKKDSTYIITEIVKYADCEGCPPGGCDSVRNTLRLMFVSDEGQHHEFHVCQGDSYDYTNMNFKTTFNSVGKLCNTPYVVTGTVEVRGVVDGKSVVMCSFEDEVTFWVDTVYKDQMTYDTICYDPIATDQTYSWYNHPKFAAIPVTAPGYFTYVDTMHTYDTGCDSICVLKLRVGQPYEMPTVEAICDNASFVWEDTLFYGINYQGAIPNNGKAKQVVEPLYTSSRHTLSRYGCDSILTLSLTIHPTYMAERKDTAICANEPYDFYGTIYNVPGAPEVWTPGNTYILTIPDFSIHGCDSMVLHSVTVYPYYPDEREPNDTVCQQKGAFYTWPNHPNWTGQQSLAAAGKYELTDPQKTIHGCDSIIHRTLVVIPSYELPFTHTMSSEDTMHWEGRIYAGATAVFDNPAGLPVVVCSDITEVVDSLTTEPVGSYTCDSVRILTLKIGKVFRDTTYDAACANCGTYNWVITSPITGRDTIIYIDDLPAPYEQRTYYDSLTTKMGYDSIYVRILTTYPNYNFAESDEVCQSEEYKWQDHMPIAIPALGGGNPPYVRHRLFVDGHEVAEIPTDRHGTIFVTDSMTTDTVFTDPKTGAVKPMHCDSVWTLTLTIHPTYNDRYVELTDYVSMSSNDTVSHFVQPHTLFVGYDFDYNAAGITPSELEQQYDRVVYMQSTGSEVWRDSAVNTSVFGCDSVRYVELRICAIKFTQISDTIADNDSTWYFGGETAHREHTLPLVTGERFHRYDDGTPVDYSQATGRTERQYLFIDTMRTANGCDSIVHNYLHVFPAYRFEEDTAICSNERFDWREYTYLNHNHSGYVYDSVNYQVGTHTFDSVYVLDLNVVPSGYWQYDTMLCMNDTILWHYQRIYYRPGGLQYVEAIYKDDQSMCGDVYHMDLHFMPVYNTDLIEHDTICQYEEYHWISEGATREHSINVRDGKGHQIKTIPTDIAGDYIYYDSLSTAACGCDSIYTLYLHVNPSFRAYDTTFVYCSSDTLRWHDREYYYQGELEVRDTIFGTAVNSCDSIHYMRIRFDMAYDETETVFLCSDVEHYQWEDIVFDDTLRDAQHWLEPRTYHFSRTYQTVLGQCDSILRLDLTIAPNFDSIWTDTLCRGETYVLFDQRITEPGQYFSQQPNRFGCSTFYYLTLEELPLPTFDLKADPVCVDETGLANSYLLHFTYTGEYEPVAYSIRYDSVAQAAGFTDAQDVAIAHGASSIELPVPAYASPTAYPRPGTYQAQIAFDNGVCLSDSLMTYDFRFVMNYPAWITEQRYGDIIAILNDSLNGGYTWSEYQWFQGDSMLVGQTKPYLYLPTGLAIGEQYHVLLTREGENEAYPTCPITVIRNPNGTDYTPTMGYLAVTPTCVVTANPTTNILSRKSGTYRISSSNGRLVGQGSFDPDTTPIRLPAVDGLYIIQLWSPDTPEEPYRAIKVLVREKCENCATSF